MRILVDILHPAHVHFFKNAIREWEKRGHQVLTTARDKDVTLNLLKAYNIDFTEISKIGKGIFGLAGELVLRNCRLIKIVKNFSPDIMFGVAGVSIAPVGKITGIPSVVFTNNEHAALSNKITFPFADVVCTASCFKKNFGKKHVWFNGYHELAYLHPDYFKPDESVLRELNLTVTDKFVIFRFVSWGAAHDIGEKWLSLQEKRKLIKSAEKYARVFITSESRLPPDLMRYHISISPEKMHSLLSFARLHIGESATMASESAVLGVPAIFVYSSPRGYTDEIRDKYELLFTFSSKNHNWRKIENKLIELLEDENMKEKWQMKRNKMLAEKTDVTKFIVGLAEKYCG
ncbi:MAG: DUF354 domain-containing protein [bacterium]